MAVCLFVGFGFVSGGGVFCAVLSAPVVLHAKGRSNENFSLCGLNCCVFCLAPVLLCVLVVFGTSSNVFDGQVFEFQGWTRWLSNSQGLQWPVTPLRPGGVGCWEIQKRVSALH